MSLFSKLRVAYILRRYMRQLRAIRHPRSLIPGPVAPDDEARGANCHIMAGFLMHRRMPMETYAELSAWWNGLYSTSMRMAPALHAGTMEPEPFDDSRPLVLTHCDLNMRNILIGDDRRIYLIDWIRNYISI